MLWIATAVRRFTRRFPAYVGLYTLCMVVACTTRVGDFRFGGDTIPGGGDGAGGGGATGSQAATGNTSRGGESSSGEGGDGAGGGASAVAARGGSQAAGNGGASGGGASSGGAGGGSPAGAAGGGGNAGGEGGGGAPVVVPEGCPYWLPNGDVARVTEGDDLDYDLAAADLDGATITLANDAPSWVSYDQGNRALAGSAPADAAGSYDVVVTLGKEDCPDVESVIRLVVANRFVVTRIQGQGWEFSAVAFDHATERFVLLQSTEAAATLLDPTNVGAQELVGIDTTETLQPTIAAGQGSFYVVAGANVLRIRAQAATSPSDIAARLLARVPLNGDEPGDVSLAHAGTRLIIADRGDEEFAYRWDDDDAATELTTFVGVQRIGSDAGELAMVLDDGAHASTALADEEAADANQCEVAEQGDAIDVRGGQVAMIDGGRLRSWPVGQACPAPTALMVVADAVGVAGTGIVVATARQSEDVTVSLVSADGYFIGDSADLTFGDGELWGITTGVVSGAAPRSFAVVFGKEYAYLVEL